MNRSAAVKRVQDSVFFLMPANNLYLSFGPCINAQREREIFIRAESPWREGGRKGEKSPSQRHNGAERSTETGIFPLACVTTCKPRPHMQSIISEGEARYYLEGSLLASKVSPEITEGTQTTGSGSGSLQHRMCERETNIKDLIHVVPVLKVPNHPAMHI